MVDEIYDDLAAARMGVENKGQVRVVLLGLYVSLPPPPPHTHTTGMCDDPQWEQRTGSSGGHW